MVTQALMGSEGVVVGGNASLSRQGSLYGLTLDEVQNQLGSLGKPLGSMNLDELMRSVWTAEAMDNGGSCPGSSINRQSSYPMSQELSKKTVEEVWREIQEGKRSQERRDTLGEMTLEEFLAQAGVGVESVDGIGGSNRNAGPGLGVDPNAVQNSQWIQQYQMLPQHQRHSVVSVFMPNQHGMHSGGVVADSAYSDSSLSPTLMGSLSGTHALGRKRVAPGDVVEKTVERRQKRMIKNRESAARSRQRRQAYTTELENKVNLLEEENKRLKRLKEVEKEVLPCVPPPEPKFQLRRTSSSPL